VRYEAAGRLDKGVFVYKWNVSECNEACSNVSLSFFCTGGPGGRTGPSL